jgi:putative RNA 2'-phosphotransferase
MSRKHHAPNDVSRSRFLSLILRHDPGAIGLPLDAQGWADIDTLLALLPPDRAMDRGTLLRLVAENPKQRFALSEDGMRIRANQGHSLEIDLALTPVPPPQVLYHGTATQALASIRREGLTRRSRRHVHLSADADTARRVGSRHGTPQVLRVHAAAMAAAGLAFYRADNGVWLTDAVPPAYIDFGDAAG